MEGGAGATVMRICVTFLMRMIHTNSCVDASTTRAEITARGAVTIWFRRLGNSQKQTSHSYANVIKTFPLNTRFTFEYSDEWFLQIFILVTVLGVEFESIVIRIKLLNKLIRFWKWHILENKIETQDDIKQI